MLSFFCVKAQWIQQSVPIPYEGYINDIRIVNANTVWGNTFDAVTHSTLYTQDFVRTIDGGNNWIQGSVGAPSQWVISNIWPVDADTCYVAMFDSTGAGGRVYKTTDGGTTWGQVGANMFQAATSFANVVYFWDAQNGIAIGDPVGSPLKYEIYLTNDYGNTWTQVPPANLPGLTNNAEYGITNLFDAIDGHIWFATTYGDVYRSTDGGNNWTKTASGFPAYVSGASRQDITQIAFSDSLNGIIFQANATTILIRSTTDGGQTWTPVTPAGGTVYPDITGVPGKPNTFVTAGSNATFGFGTSFTMDGGVNWIDLDMNISHTAIDFLDSVTGWTGEYIQLGTFGGAYKFDGVLAAVACTSPNISPGVSSVNDTSICFNDTLTVITTGVLAPTEGTTHGFSLIVSTADISGNNDPLSDPSVVGGTGVIGGTPPPTVLINDQGIFPPGVYYFTPVVYGNAIGTGNVTQLILDPNCTYTGTSVYVNLLDIGDPQCTVGLTELELAQLAVYTSMSTPDVLNVHIRATKNDDQTSIEIFDLTGRKVFSNQYSVLKGSNDISINMAAFSGGTYILKTESAGAVATTKLVKM
jgi:photosystem II stability/assembly factor-like uncharacterized protein